NALERKFAATMNHSSSTAVNVHTALCLARPSCDNDNAPQKFDSFFPNGNRYNFDSQLQTVAQFIWAAATGQGGITYPRRQIFFVSIGGYDTHSDELNQQDALLQQLDQVLSGFYNALASVPFGTGPTGTLADVATAFTVSDFGRSMTPNSGGTDHGWGSHH